MELQINKIGKSWLILGLSWFVIVAILGLLLRYLVVSDQSAIEYKFILHAHSHVALLGWVFTSIMVIIIHQFVNQKFNAYKKVFYFTQFTIIGMLLSFPFQGYALFSITFSTLFLFASYWFIYKVLNDIKSENSSLTSIKFLKSSLFYLALSSIGPWSLGPIMATGHSYEPIYYNTIYFYLHFLYNGFIVMAIMAFIYRQLELEGVKNNGKLVYQLIQWSIIPSYFLSVYWSWGNAIIYTIGGLGAILLFSSLFPFYHDIIKYFKNIQPVKKLKPLFRIIFISYIIKLTMQLFSAIPSLSEAVYQNSKYIVIGYLHLIFLGVFSLFFIVWASNKGYLSNKRLGAKWGISLFVIGFLISEFLLFYHGAKVWFQLPIIENHHYLIAFSTALMPIGLAIYIVNQLLKSN